LTADHGWLAGIIDGEGCITIRRKENPTPSVELVVGMTDETAVRRCQAIAGRGSVTLVVNGRQLPLWFWGVYSHNAKSILWLLYPLFTAKRARAKEALGVHAG